MKTFTTLALIACAWLTSFTPAAEAGEARVSRFYERTAAVYVADLDLESVVDAHELYERIGYAARAVCTADELSFDIRRKLHWRQCVDEAMETAVERANAPLLTSIHQRQRAQLAAL